MKVLIIIPAYNEAKNLPAVFENIRKTGENYDILVINDSSIDSTAKVCREHGVKVVNLPVNLGIGGAVQTGYKYALIHGYDYAVQVDGDGQHDPKFIKYLIKRLDQGYHLCIGSRFIENEGYLSSRARRMGIKYFSWLIRLLSRQCITDPTSGFRACGREVIRLFASDYPRDYPEPETIMTVLKNKFKICEMPVIMNAREGGVSSITGLKAVYYMLKVSIAIIITSISGKSSVMEDD
jgi:glycosyltransferase involved in cell wall biosynthesis